MKNRLLGFKDSACSLEPERFPWWFTKKENMNAIFTRSYPFISVIHVIDSFIDDLISALEKLSVTGNWKYFDV